KGSPDETEECIETGAATSVGSGGPRFSLRSWEAGSRPQLGAGRGTTGRHLERKAPNRGPRRGQTPASRPGSSRGCGAGTEPKNCKVLEFRTAGRGPAAASHP